MTLTAIATATAVRPTRTSRPGIPTFSHALLVAWLVGMLGLARFYPFEYQRLLQEDGPVEWLTVTLFLAAAVVRLRSAWPARRWFDLLIAAFCIFVAGEEFSWGQRLLGFTPPTLFLEHNYQQEFTIHNFADIFGKPKSVLILAIAGYGVLLPVAAAFSRGRALLERIGATPPQPGAVPWLIAAIILLVWYPFELTGEWVEAMTGFVFFSTAARSSYTRVTGGLLALSTAAGLTLYSTTLVSGAPSAIACAEAQTQALVADLQRDAATDRLLHKSGSIHKRLWSAIQDDYVEAAHLTNFRATRCGNTSDYAVDPWGMAYWLRSARTASGERTYQVYSMGPNRRRDADDIASE